MELCYAEETVLVFVFFYFAGKYISSNEESIILMQKAVKDMSSFRKQPSY
jgi:hypothetical protein